MDDEARRAAALRERVEALIPVLAGQAAEMEALRRLSDRTRRRLQGQRPSPDLPADYVVDELNRRQLLAERPCMTLDRSDFYGLCGRERLKQPFLDDIQENASGRFQLIVAYGDYAVVVCHDRNFAEAGPGAGKRPRG